MSENWPLLDPIGDENVGFARRRGVPVGFPDYLPAVGGEHRKTVKSFVESDLLQAGAVAINQKEIEIAAAWIVHV